MSGVVTVRALPSSEYSEFTKSAHTDFEQTEFKITPDCNRQGYRLEGAALKTKRKLELLSHGVVPGTVQVPPSGQPIVQMAEANTLGGYPKIATVIGADLWRLAQMRAGQTVRFNIVDNVTAVNALRENLTEQNNLQMELAAVGAASKRNT
jgi:allophanate hydrolase subunit 2